MQIFKNPNFNFVGYRWHALCLSWALIIAGLLTVYFKGLPLGVEFSRPSLMSTTRRLAPMRLATFLEACSAIQAACASGVDGAPLCGFTLALFCTVPSRSPLIVS